jgi:anti-sigma B factor antagonist
MRSRESSTPVVEEFGIHEERSPGGTVVLVLRGEADLYAAPAVRDRLLDAVEGGSRGIVVDLSDVTFVDSMMLGVLLAGLKRMRGTGQFRVVVSSPDVRRLFEITLLDRVFALDPSRQAALAAIDSSAR